VGMDFKEGIHYSKFSEQGDPLLFLHANAYTPDCYRPLLTPFMDQYNVFAFKLRAIWPKSNLADVSSWMDFVADCDAFLEEQSLRDIVGMGHSIGAVMTLLLEIIQPGRFKHIVLLDPVLFPFSNQLGLLIFKLIIGHLRFVKKTYERQVLFASIDDVFQHYRTKKIFKFIDDANLTIICQSLFKKTDQGVELIQTPEWEAKIYKIGGLSYPFLWKNINKIKCPILLLAGEHSHICKVKEIQKLSFLASKFDYKILDQSSHLLPFEAPLKNVEYIKLFLSSTYK
tara:strand:+ start:16908 stop:17759 length:852 start_codon:yes stop_codon:yes gene_type:complete